MTVYSDQWVHKTGAQRLEIKGVSRHKTSGQKWTLGGNLLQKERVFRLRVPIQVYFRSDTLDTVLVTAQAKTPLSFSFDQKPLGIGIDPDYNVMRRLNHGEMSPVLSLALSDENAVIVLPSRSTPEFAEAYRLLAHQLIPPGDGMIKSDVEVTNADLKSGSVFVLGSPEENAVYGKMGAALKGRLAFRGKTVSLAGNTYTGKSVIAAFWNPLNRQKGLCVFQAASPKVVRSLGMKMMHYGKYSYLVFDGTKAIAKGEWPVKENPLIVKF